MFLGIKAFGSLADAALYKLWEQSNSCIKCGENILAVWYRFKLSKCGSVHGMGVGVLKVGGSVVFGDDQYIGGQNPSPLGEAWDTFP